MASSVKIIIKSCLQAAQLDLGFLGSIQQVLSVVTLEQVRSIAMKSIQFVGLTFILFSLSGCCCGFRQFFNRGAPCTNCGSAPLAYGGPLQGAPCMDNAAPAGVNVGYPQVESAYPMEGEIVHDGAAYEGITSDPVIMGPYNSGPIHSEPSYTSPSYTTPGYSIQTPTLVTPSPTTVSPSNVLPPQGNSPR